MAKPFCPSLLLWRVVRHLLPVYATNEDDITDFKIWKINYPPNIKQITNILQQIDFVLGSAAIIGSLFRFAAYITAPNEEWDAMRIKATVTLSDPEGEGGGVAISPSLRQEMS